ncbi:hypothetical protein HanHA300_Chr02g0060121 [Helianthus annuus]|uniref:Zinc finger, RING/FYVE/PHD-type n=1 Tax=Helianthus annuus TaxID=4232 RepID=A0A251VID9_HELAN|nr:hypothetical protein HanHA300_Chr02g0060121 [Helianthus annuus]KAJ0619216.1 hypothetical protein HanHA89_Chr02g0068851 [Helianthus annuus]KAJ0777667.1 hypothetical protein HanLR1_Chr02g0063091 [Helianthus annuus]KAJ0786692.1 hypothetical protein HanOQP8_Chr02g0074161 [Helianthus annuus]
MFFVADGLLWMGWLAYTRSCPSCRLTGVSISCHDPFHLCVIRIPIKRHRRLAASMISSQEQLNSSTKSTKKL